MVAIRSIAPMICLLFKVSALGRLTALPLPPRKRRFNLVFAAEPAKAANRDPQRPAGVLIAFVYPRYALDLLPAKSSVHEVSSLLGNGFTPFISKGRTTVLRRSQLICKQSDKIKRSVNIARVYGGVRHFWREPPAARVDGLKEFVYVILHLFYIQNICFTTYSFICYFNKGSPRKNRLNP